MLRFGAEASSPANGDPRSSRTTPNALLARIEEAEAADASGSTKAWAGRILRDRSRKAPVYSDGRKQMLQLMQGKTVAAEKAAVERLRGKQVHVASLAPSQPAGEPQESAFMAPRKRARFPPDRT